MKQHNMKYSARLMNHPNVLTNQLIVYNNNEVRLNADRRIHMDISFLYYVELIKQVIHWNNMSLIHFHTTGSLLKLNVKLKIMLVGNIWLVWIYLYLSNCYNQLCCLFVALKVDGLLKPLQIYYFEQNFLLETIDRNFWLLKFYEFCRIYYIFRINTHLKKIALKIESIKDAN